MALGATVPFSRLSCGFVGSSDGWTDLADNFQMDWEFDGAMNGNLALTGELDLKESHEFTLGLASGDSLHSAISTLFQALNPAFEEQKQEYREQWQRSQRELHPLDKVSSDQGCLFQRRR